jgi:hypothetical protein
MAEPSPQLLGRKPSPPDLRDFRLANFQALGSELVAGTAEDLALYAAAELRKTTITYKQWAARYYSDVTVTHWWKAFNALAQIAGGPPPVPTTDKSWDVTGFQLDQSNTGHCVGFSWAGWSDAEPVENTYGDSDGHAIYYECKVIEGRPGEEDGAYPRDGAKAMQARGRLTTYAAAATIADVLAWLRQHGPLVVGTDWTYDMFEPDASGYIKPTGGYAGGHAYLLYGVQGDTLIFKNSWGGNWGLSGSFKMKLSDWTGLYQAYGEAWTSVELPL